MSADHIVAAKATLFQARQHTGEVRIGKLKALRRSLQASGIKPLDIGMTTVEITQSN